jgi:hypothetical protein
MRSQLKGSESSTEQTNKQTKPPQTIADISGQPNQTKPKPKPKPKPNQTQTKPKPN